MAKKPIKYTPQPKAMVLDDSDLNPYPVKKSVEKGKKQAAKKSAKK